MTALLILDLLKKALEKTTFDMSSVLIISFSPSYCIKNMIEVNSIPLKSITQITIL